LSRPLVTILIPAYNEAENLPIAYTRLCDIVEKLTNFTFEFIVIDNCSSDATPTIAKSFVERDPRWRYIRFSKNFGLEASMAAGLHYATGDAVIFVFSDLQDPPEYIPTMLRKWKEDKCDVVYGCLTKRADDNWIKTIGAKIAYYLIYHWTEVKIPPNATDFRLITRRVIEVLDRIGERNRYLRGLVHWVGFKQSSFEYVRRPREHGESKWGTLQCIGLALTALSAFSVKPLRLASLFGVVSAMASGFGLFAFLTLKLLSLYGYADEVLIPPGWTTLVLLVLFFGGINCIFIGILGEYIGRTFLEVKNRPLWLVDEALPALPQAKSLSEHSALRSIAS